MLAPAAAMAEPVVIQAQVVGKVAVAVEPEVMPVQVAQVAISVLAAQILFLDLGAAVVDQVMFHPETQPVVEVVVELAY
jgi:hypothetical protein